MADFDEKPPATVPTLEQNTGNGKLGVIGEVYRDNKEASILLSVWESRLPKEAICQEFIEAGLDCPLNSLAGYSCVKDPLLIQSTHLRTYHHPDVHVVLKAWSSSILLVCLSFFLLT
jgi:hypothetical protein